MKTYNLFKILKICKLLIEFMLTSNKTLCVTKCETDEYVKIKSSLQYCEKCATPLPNCLKCTTSSICSECFSGLFFKYDLKGCLDKCLVDETLMTN